MMGQLPAAQNALFYEFSLEQHISNDHLLRQVDQFLDFDSIRQHLTPYYSYTGRPSIDPELMIRMLLVGYCYGIHSERRLCEEVNLNLAYRWFCRLGLEDAVPDHSTFSKNRHGRFRESDLLRNARAEQPKSIWIYLIKMRHCTVHKRAFPLLTRWHNGRAQKGRQISFTLPTT